MCLPFFHKKIYYIMREIQTVLNPQIEKNTTDTRSAKNKHPT